MKKNMSYEATLFDGLEDLAREAIEEQQECLKNASMVYVKEPVWITSDGRQMRIPEMSTTHIKNCIKLIYSKNGNWRHEYLRLFETELRKRRMMGRDFDDDTSTLQKKKIGRLLKQLGTLLETC